MERTLWLQAVRSMIVHYIFGEGNRQLDLVCCIQYRMVGVYGHQFSRLSGTEESTGAGGCIGISLFRFLQNTALGPFMMNVEAHLVSPLIDSGWCTEKVNSDAKDKTNVVLHYCRFRHEASSYGSWTHHSANWTAGCLLRNHSSDTKLPRARGRTYSAISPLRLAFSIQMLAPHTSEPARVPPQGPSHTSCEIIGKSRASTRVRVKQNANQYEETNVERKVALRMADKSAGI